MLTPQRTCRQDVPLPQHPSLHRDNATSPSAEQLSAIGYLPVRRRGGAKSSHYCSDAPSFAPSRPEPPIQENPPEPPTTSNSEGLPPPWRSASKPSAAPAIGRSQISQQAKLNLTTCSVRTDLAARLHIMAPLGLLDAAPYVYRHHLHLTQCLSPRHAEHSMKHIPARFPGCPYRREPLAL